MADPDNSPVTTSFEAAWIEQGVITDVDLQEGTCSFLSNAGKITPGLEILSPYFHTHAGEGFFAVPDIGASVAVCFPSDNAASFVLGYLSGPEDGGVPTPVEGMETSVSQITNEPTEGEVRPSTTTFRAGRLDVSPGSIVLHGRDGNKVVLHRGGVVEIGSTPLAQRFYIPVLNTIKDVAENAHVLTPGGQLSWTVDRKEDDEGASAPALYRLSLRDKVNDAKASVQIKMGHVDSSKRIEVVVAPTGIDVADGRVVSVTPLYKMTVDQSGNKDVTLRGKLSYKVSAGRDVTVTGMDSLTVNGSRTVKITGMETKTITGMQTVTGVASTEVWSGTKIIQAPIVMLGSTPIEQIPLGRLLLQWLQMHVETGHATTPPPLKKAQIAGLAAIVSKTVKVSP